MKALSKSPATLAKPVDRPARWARDFAVVGGVTGALAPLAVIPGLLGSGYIAAAGVAGAISGAAIGLVARRFLTRSGETPLPALLMGGVGLGAVWGGVVGALAGLATNDPFVFWKVSAVLGSVAGAMQFGWMWLPYVLKQLGRKKTWPVVLAASVIAPGLGWLGVMLFALFGHLF